MNYLNFNNKPENGYGYIYLYKSPSGKCYIGQTIRSLKERAGKNGINYENSKIFYRAILKYGIENFKVYILETVEINKLDEREKYYIKLYNTIQPNGYNIKKGGASSWNESKNEKRICKYNLDGRLIKTYKSLQEAAKDNNTQYQAISAVCRHKRPQHNNYIYRYYNDLTELCYQKDNHKLGRPTAQLDEEGNIIKVFPSASQAAIAIGKNSSDGRNIRLVCSGKRKHAYGYRWKYID